MSSDNHIKPAPDHGEHSSESDIPASGNMKESFIQNPDQNNQIHREALGRNTKR